MEQTRENPPVSEKERLLCCHNLLAAATEQCAELELARSELPREVVVDFDASRQEHHPLIQHLWP